MLYEATTLASYQIGSLDDEFGKVKEFYFDDRNWAIRYLVADTGVWLRGRQVLISPHSLGQAVPEEKHIAVNLTRDRIEECPSLSVDQPVSRQYEHAYHGYYGLPGLWTAGLPLLETAEGFQVAPASVPPSEGSAMSGEAADQSSHDPHLRSTAAMLGNHVEATDGGIGHVDDFIIDDNDWSIRYLVIDTKNWWPGGRVLVSPDWIGRLGWEEERVFINRTRDEIRQLPEFAGIDSLERDR